MKRLILMRHAAAQPEQLYPNDRERFLSSEGMHELELIRRKLQGKVEGLDLVLCSNVRRTRQTLEGIKPILPSGCESSFEDGLYHASVAYLMNCIRAQNNKQDYIMIIAHNPGVHHFLEMVLSSAQENSAISKGFPTSGTAIFEGNFKKWQDAAPALLTLQAFIVPQKCEK
jgi:phosphohistidine phosphatase